MKYAFFPGCDVPKRGTPELQPAAVAVCEKLGIELEQLLLAPCTGSGILQGDDPFYAAVLNASTMAMAEEMGLPMMVICSTCQGIYSQVSERFRREPEFLAQVNERLTKEGIEYKGTTEVKHLAWVLVEDLGLEKLKSMVVRPLTQLHIAPFIGCYMLRPSSALGFDEYPERRRAIESVITALGAQLVENLGKTQCCGYPLVGANDSAAGAMVADHTLEAKTLGADAMVTPCPLCHMNLDGVQPAAGEQRGTRIEMPVFHLPQLVGLALGIEPEDLGFSRHVISVTKVISNIAVAP